jgi:hypothetical protein
VCGAECGRGAPEAWAWAFAACAEPVACWGEAPHPAVTDNAANVTAMKRFRNTGECAEKPEQDQCRAFAA